MVTLPNIIKPAIVTSMTPIPLALVVACICMNTTK